MKSNHNDNAAQTIRICIDNVVYRMCSYAESSNILIYLDGVYVHPDIADGLELGHNEHCCVFSNLVDLLAYVTLARHNDEICNGISRADYMVIKANNRYQQTYELLKRYKEVHGFLRVNDANRVANSILAGLLGVSFTNEDCKICGDKALVSYCMRKYKALEI